MEKQGVHKSDKNLLLQYGLQDIDLTWAVRFVYQPGEVLFREGDKLDYIYFVISGKAKVLLSLSDGKRLLLTYFISKGSIGDLELMDGNLTAFATMEVVTQFTCVALPLNIYGKILRENYTFVSYVAKELASRLMMRTVNGAITTLQPLEARLCAYITQTAREGFFCEILTEVADIVGASYRHLLRCLDKLCNEKILERIPLGFKIINQQILDEKAGDLYVLK
jgi:CRP-like cAMP-binding protein